MMINSPILFKTGINNSALRAEYQNPKIIEIKIIDRYECCFIQGRISPYLSTLNIIKN